MFEFLIWILVFGSENINYFLFQENSTKENIETNLDGFTGKKKIKIFNRQNIVAKTSLPNSPFNVGGMSRKSFLAGDEKTLQRLSNLIKNSDSDGITIDSGKSRNFVFTTLSPSVNENKNVIKR